MLLVVVLVVVVRVGALFDEGELGAGVLGTDVATGTLAVTDILVAVGILAVTKVLLATGTLVGAGVLVARCTLVFADDTLLVVGSPEPLVDVRLTVAVGSILGTLVVRLATVDELPVAEVAAVGVTSTVT